MKKHAKRVFILLLALLFLVFGVVGLVLPFLQGILFIAVSLILLSMLSPTTRTWFEHYTRKWPKFHAVVVRAERYITRIIGEV